MRFLEFLLILAFFLHPYSWAPPQKPLKARSRTPTEEPSWKVPVTTKKKTGKASVARDPSLGLVLIRIKSIREALSNIGSCTKDENSEVFECKDGTLANLWKAINEIDLSSVNARYEEGKKGKLSVTQPYLKVQDQISNVISAPPPAKTKSRKKTSPKDPLLTLEGIRKIIADYKNELLYFARLFSHSPADAEQLNKAIKGEKEDLDLNLLLDNISSSVGTFHTGHEDYTENLYDLIDKKIKELLRVKKMNAS
jgi:hypothetical protein